MSEDVPYRESERWEHKLLSQLKEEREFTKSDKDIMQGFVDLLVTLGVYPESTPAMENHGYTHLQMVESWGAHWHEWREPLSCPSCGSDWRDQESGPPFKREIGIYSQGQDRTAAWKCPDCGEEMPR